MVLDPRSSFPSIRSYVLKLHRDAEPSRGRLAGYLENMSSGRRFEFSTPEQLIACLANDAQANAAG
jgi:hypothetical protein